MISHCLFASLDMFMILNIGSKSFGGTHHWLFLHLVDIGFFCPDFKKIARGNKLASCSCQCVKKHGCFDSTETLLTRAGSVPVHSSTCSCSCQYQCIKDESSLGTTLAYCSHGYHDCHRFCLGSSSTGMFSCQILTFFSIVSRTHMPFIRNLKQHVTKIVHPLVSSTAITLLMTYFIGLVTGTSFLQTVRKYKVGSIAPMKTGAGDILLYLLGPSVVSFAWPMFSRRKVIVDNLLPVVTSMIVASVGGLFGTAAFVRLIAVGGTRVGSRMLRVSLIPRTVTTPLAIAIANILGGDISIAAAAVVLTGIFGATIGGSFLTSLGIHDPVSRGMAIGAAAQGVGVASFINEKEAYPFAAISMVLTAVAATALISIPAIKATLLNIVGGN
jgi:putative effector of murein hydrolase